MMKLTMWTRALPAVGCVLVSLALATAAPASRILLSEAAVQTTFCAHCAPVPPNEEHLRPPTEGQIEGPCGLALAPAGDVYLSDYYHRVIDVFAPPPSPLPLTYLSQIVLPGRNPVFGSSTLDAVCGLAFDAEANLYANEFHRGVLRLTPSELRIDEGESTGLAIDAPSNRLWVDDRTYLAEYVLPIAEGAKPLTKVGVGSLGDGYGLAAFGGRLYVADAASGTIKVYQPATSTTTPVATIGFGFKSLTDAALAIDPSNGHLLVVDNAQPGFEHPHAAIYEFDSAANGYAFLGQLPGAPIDGGPSGIVVAPDGRLLVTDGNSELANVFAYGPYSASSPPVPGAFAPLFTQQDPAQAAPTQPMPPAVQGGAPGPRAAHRHTRHRRRQRAASHPSLSAGHALRDQADRQR
jgi:hypothetical protein